MQDKMLLKICSISIVFFCLCYSAMAQETSPCAKVELRASAAEANATAERIRANMAEAQTETLQRQLASQRGQTQEANQRLGAERQSATLVTSIYTAQQKIAELEKALAEMDKMLDSTTERLRKAMLRIKKANGRWLCDELHIMCIKEDR